MSHGARMARLHSFAGFGLAEVCSSRSIEDVVKKTRQNFTTYKMVASDHCTKMLRGGLLKVIQQEDFPQEDVL